MDTICDFISNQSTCSWLAEVCNRSMSYFEAYQYWKWKETGYFMEYSSQIHYCQHLVLVDSVAQGWIRRSVNKIYFPAHVRTESLKLWFEHRRNIRSARKNHFWNRSNKRNRQVFATGVSIRDSVLVIEIRSAWIGFGRKISFAKSRSTKYELPLLCPDMTLL